jgi:5,10-methylene-tetrahydrofolate dehydrogenase/methenyl tetrahydrofolate cyclohydrolase
VILIPTCKIETGKDVDGIEVSHSRKFLSALFVPCVAAPCVEINIQARQGRNTRSRELSCILEDSFITGRSCEYGRNEACVTMHHRG